jgi:hypothetical protein
MSDIGYLKQKLFEAVLSLVGDGDLNTRLTYAAIHLVMHLNGRGIPDQFQLELFEIQAALTATPLSSETGYLPRNMGSEEANALSRRILGLYTEVMGGL